MWHFFEQNPLHFNFLFIIWFSNPVRKFIFAAKESTFLKGVGKSNILFCDWIKVSVRMLPPAGPLPHAHTTTHYYCIFRQYSSGFVFSMLKSFFFCKWQPFLTLIIFGQDMCVAMLYLLHFSHGPIGMRKRIIVDFLKTHVGLMVSAFVFRIKKSWFEHWPRTLWARHFTLTVPLSTQV